MTEIKVLTCRECKEEKPVSAFHVKTDSKTGFHKQCKLCRSKSAGHKPNFRTRNSAKSKPASEAPKVTQDELIEEIHQNAAQHPDNSRYQKMSAELREYPDGPFSKSTQAWFYNRWHQKMERSGATIELDRVAPIITKAKQRTIKILETSLSENPVDWCE